VSTTTRNIGRLRPAIARANAAIFVSTAVRGLLTWLAVVGGTWLALFALDNLLNLPATLRFVLSMGGVLVTIWVFWKQVVVPLSHRKTNEQVALMLEKKYGIPENVLINAMQFEGMQYGERQKDFILETTKAGSVGWQSVPLRELWQFGRLGAWALAFAVLASLIALYVLWLPRYAASAADRYLYSLSDVPPVGSFSLDLDPDRGVTIAEHETLPITLAVSELAKGAKLATYPELFFKEGVQEVDGSQSDGMAVMMEPVMGKPDVYKYTFEDVRHDFAFRVFAGDTYSHSIPVRVIPASKIVESRFSVTPPAYTAEEAYERAGPPHSVRCLPRSKLGIEIKLDRAAEKLQWLWSQGIADFESPDGLSWKASVEVGTSAGAYDVEVTGKELKRTVRIASGSVVPLDDRRPDVRFVETATSRTVTPGERLALQIEAGDDYGIGQLQVTSRPAYGGSLPEVVRQWEFGAAPGHRGKIDKKFELTVDASDFAPGRQYFLEARAKDFCPDNGWSVSDPVLLTVTMVDKLESADDGLAKLYEALERAIQLQKEALDGTRNLLSNIDNVWLDMNREPRSAEEIQDLLDKYRAAVLGRQLGVREALLAGVEAVPEDENRMAARMQEIAEMEAVEANDRAFSSARRVCSAGELKPAVEDAFSTGAGTRIVRFDSRKGRYFGFMVVAPQGWSDETWIGNLSLLGEDGSRLDSSAWKVVSASGGAGAEAAFANQGWRARGRLPHILVADMGDERTVTGIVCAGHDRMQPPKDFRLYLSTQDPPDIVFDAPGQTRVIGEFEPLQEVQEAIYNQLLALKGREAAAIAKREEEKVRKALGEKGIEQAPTVAEKLKDFQDKLREWVSDHEENVEKRKAIMGRPPEDFTEEDRRNLAELNLQKLKQARKLQDWVDDLADSGVMDFGDPSEVHLSEIFQMSKELADLAALAAKSSAPGEYTWNMDTLIAEQAEEILTEGPQSTVSGDEPGSGEAREDMGLPPSIPELPSELALTIPELREALKGMEPMIEQAGMAMMDHGAPSGPPMGDIYSSMSASGKMGDTTPDPNKKAAGRSNLGRSGQADGQMVANQAPPVEDDEVAMPNRMSSTPLEEGAVDDQGGQTPTSVGLSKPGQKPTDFAMAGMLPPSELRKMREFAGQTGQLRENIRELMLNLNSHNLPTVDLQKAIQRLDQIDMAIKGGDGVGIRRAFDAAIGYVTDAERAVAGAIEMRRRDLAQERKRREIDSGGRVETIPEGYEEMVTSYFKRLAEQSASAQ